MAENDEVAETADHAHSATSNQSYYNPLYFLPNLKHSNYHN